MDSEHREEVIECLIKHGADVNFPGKSENIDDTRPLHLAAMWGYDTTVKLLLYHGADASLRDSNGFSPVDYASVFDNYLCIGLLLKYGCLTAEAEAWSAIMDSSYGESIADSSLDERFTTALDLGGDDTRRDRSAQGIQGNILDSLYENEEYDPLDAVREDEIDLEMENRLLRLELKKLGRNPGPITATTKK